MVLALAPCGWRVLNAVDPRSCANEQSIAHDGRRSHPHIIFSQLIGVQDFELVAVLQDIGQPSSFRQKILPFMAQGRRCKGSTVWQSLLAEKLFTSLGVFNNATKPRS